MYDTYSWFHHTLNEHTVLKGLPEIMSGSAEFRQVNLPKSPLEKKEIAKLLQENKSQMLKPKYNHPVCIKGNVLMHSHLLRKSHVLDEKLALDLKYMLRLSNSLIDAMISVCQNQDLLQTAMNCIEYGQYVVQACWVKDSPLLQLPHFTPEQVKHCEKGKASQRATNIQEYRAIPNDDKKGMADFTEEQKQDVYKTLQVIPDISVESMVYVDDDEDDQVYEGDLCTVKVTITRNNLKKGEKAGLVHAPKFPFPNKKRGGLFLEPRMERLLVLKR
jgi:translocation protein SEC63